ncbi:MAG: ribose-phosphate diphosphokinase [archaeon]|nr:ribose-phosphate diphosphokinase [archaeon]
MIVFPMSNSLELGKSIAKKTGAKLGKLKSELFPDGEFHMQFLDPIKDKEVVLVQSLHPNPNDTLMELYFAGRTAKELGAKKVTGVVPYLAYMRQDKRFHAGEIVSNNLMAHLLNTCLDRIITVDPHLHRVHNLAELFHIDRKKITANEAIADYIAEKFSKFDTVIIGPDIESYQWASRIAEKIKFPSSIFLKERFSSRKVKVKVMKELEWKGKKVIIVDDIISSGHTMIEAIKEIKKKKVKEIHCICVHGVFAENAFEKMKKAGAKTIISCNTIPHKSNGIDLAEMIVEQL